MKLSSEEKQIRELKLKAEVSSLSPVWIRCRVIELCVYIGE